MNRVIHTIIDASGERSTVTHFLPTITNANFLSVVGNGVGQGVGDLRLAVAGLTLGNFVRHSVIVYSDIVPLAAPANPLAQRELRYRFGLLDASTFQRYSFEVPCPDLTIGLVANTDEVDLTDPTIAALVTILENDINSPDGNGYIVEYCRLVGRNA